MLAVLYGVIFYHSIWYPINLLAGTLVRSLGNSHDGSDDAFPDGLVPVRAGHAHHHVPACGTSVWRDAAPASHRPIVLGGIIGPLLWTGLLYHILGFVNPLLDQRINWWWFAVSQVGFRQSLPVWWWRGKPRF